jgi:hypothetical protein
MYVCLLRSTATVADWCGVGRVTIDMLPDVALLEIFDCYVNQAREEEEGTWTKIQAWHTLVHVCRKWRTIVLGSPRRLDLRLFCTDKTPVKETLAVWPPLPIVIGHFGQPTQMDNIIVALEHNDRVCQIRLGRLQIRNWKKLGSDAATIPGANGFGDLVEDDDELWKMKCRSRSRIVLGWICTTSTTSRVEPRSISGITETTFVCHWPCHSSHLGNSSFRIHFTRGDGPLPLHVDEARKPLARIRIPSISPYPGKPTSTSAHTLGPPCSHLFYRLKGSVNTWRTSWPGSMRLYSTAWK